MTDTFDPAKTGRSFALALTDYGWSAHFQAQLEMDELAETIPVRVMAVHRNALDVAGPDYEGRILPLAAVADKEDSAATAGDWLLIDRPTLRPRRILQRRSLFRRRAAGPKVRAQLIAANIDTLFIVSSCNQDFNPARIERYLALAREAEVTPVIVLTKADLADSGSHTYIADAARLSSGVLVEALDARSPREVARLGAWCGRGQTVALLGSSGVGKSTLLNTLSGETIQTVGGIRAGDEKGKHTTTGRSLHRLGSGAWLLDTPGMRELQLAGVEAGIDAVFGDVAELGRQCRFKDCRHETEPDCAVRNAISQGALDAERLKRYRKLLREDARNTETLAEANARSRSFGRHVKRIMKAKRDRNGF